MNKAYRVIWNACTNTWTAVQENAKAKENLLPDGFLPSLPHWAAWG